MTDILTYWRFSHYEIGLRYMQHSHGMAAAVFKATSSFCIAVPLRLANWFTSVNLELVNLVKTGNSVSSTQLFITSVPPNQRGVSEPYVRKNGVMNTNSLVETINILIHIIIIIIITIIIIIIIIIGLVVIMSDYWSWGCGFDPGTSTNFKCGLGLERGPPSLARTIG